VTALPDNITNIFPGVTCDKVIPPSYLTVHLWGAGGGGGQACPYQRFTNPYYDDGEYVYENDDGDNGDGYTRRAGGGVGGAGAWGEGSQYVHEGDLLRLVVGEVRWLGLVNRFAVHTLLGLRSHTCHRLEAYTCLIQYHISS
jgi:hypothetical protein